MATTRSAAVREAALKLSLKARARLAHELLVSLEGTDEPDPDWEEAWTAELERRSREIREGTAKLIDADTVFREVRAELRKLHNGKKKRTSGKARSGQSRRSK